MLYILRPFLFQELRGGERQECPCLSGVGDLCKSKENCRLDYTRIVPNKAYREGESEVRYTFNCPIHLEKADFDRKGSIYFHRYLRSFF